MDFKFSDKALSFRPNIFNILNDKKNELLDAGRKVYNFSVGTPDFKPDEHVMKAVSEAALNADNYKYSLVDTDEMLDAVVGWYGRRYGVELKHDEIMSVAGTQEGMGHIALTMCNEGDIVLVPNPGYPILEVGPYLNGAKIVHYDLHKDNGYLPDLNAIDGRIADKAKMMVVSYPLNPVCKCAPKSFYEELVTFAKAHDLLIVNDNAYSEIVYDGREGFSFLSIPGAKDVGVEFNSLSKTYNLTGLRISYLIGNSEIIKKYRTIRSQYDYGMSYLAQKAAVEALNGPQDSVYENRRRYQERRDALCGGLRSIGWNVPDSEGTMFVWAPLPAGYTDSEKFCMDFLENTGIICTPGSSFGSLGEGHVRFALVHPVDVINEAVGVAGQWLTTKQ